MTMLKPTQRPCKTCMYFDPKTEWCIPLETAVAPWWKGCIRHVEKEEKK